MCYTGGQYPNENPAQSLAAGATCKQRNLPTMKKSSVKPADSQPQLFDTVKQLIVYQLPDGGSLDVQFVPEDQTIWLTQREMAALLNLDVSSVSRHIQNYKDQGSKHAQRGIAHFAIPTNGGVQVVVHYNLDVILFVGYRAQSNERTIAFRDWASDIILQHVKTQQEQQIRGRLDKRNADVTAYRMNGKPEDWANTRVDTKQSHDALKNALTTMHADTPLEKEPDYGRMFGAQYIGLFNKAKAVIVEELGLTTAQAKNLRDHLGFYALQALNIASSAAADRIKTEGHELTNDEQWAIVIEAARLVAPAFKATAAFARRDFISGDPVDEQGNRLRASQPKLLNTGK